MSEHPAVEVLAVHLDKRYFKERYEDMRRDPAYTAAMDAYHRMHQREARAMVDDLRACGLLTPHQPPTDAARADVGTERQETR